MFNSTGEDSKTNIFCPTLLFITFVGMAEVTAIAVTATFITKQLTLRTLSQNPEKAAFTMKHLICCLHECVICVQRIPEPGQSTVRKGGTIMEGKVETFCGGYCGACPLYMATMHGTIDALSIAINKPAEMILCYGCKSGHVAKEWCEDCFIKRCCLEKQIDTCIECSTYPCSELIEFQNREDFPYHKEHASLLEIIKNQGMQSWRKTNEKRWSCPDCGTPYNWEQKTCVTCGNAVDGYAAEE